MSPERRPLIAGNWKSFNGGASGVELAQAVVAMARSVPSVDVVIAPPYTVLAACAHECDGSRVAIAAQNMHAKMSGPFTGEISPAMLLESGCTWVILGHSERRHLFAETDHIVAEKVVAAVGAGLAPIVCVGETLAEREDGATLDVIHRQIHAFLDTIAATHMACAIAYEPVWAIGTGKHAGPDEAEQVHSTIRSWLRATDGAVAERTRILYGGSVKPDNAGSLLAAPNVDGALVGGASLDPAAFGAIASRAQSLAAATR